MLVIKNTTGRNFYPCIVFIAWSSAQGQKVHQIKINQSKELVS